MNSTPFSVKIDGIETILTISKDTVSAKAKKDDRLLFEISLQDLVLCNNQARNIILNWNAGNVIASAVITSRHASEIVRKIQQSV